MTIVSDWLFGEAPTTLMEQRRTNMDEEYADIFLRRVLVDTLSRVLDQKPKHRDAFLAPYNPDMIHISPWFLDTEYAKLRLTSITSQSLRLAESNQDYPQCILLISQEWGSCTPVSFLWRISLISYFCLITTNPHHATLHAIEAFDAVFARKDLLPRPIAFAAAAVSLATAIHLCVSRGLFRAANGVPWLTQALIEVIALHPGFSSSPRTISEDSTLLCLYSNFACAVASTGRNDLARLVLKATEKRTRLLCEQNSPACPKYLTTLRGVILHNQATLFIRSGDWPRAYASVAELQILLGLHANAGYDCRLYDIIELAIDNLDANDRGSDDDDEYDEDDVIMFTDCGSTDADSSPLNRG